MKPKKKKASKGVKIPKHGRSSKEIDRDFKRLRDYSADVPLGNTDPTVVYGKMVGGMPNKSRKATGGLKKLKGRR